MQACTPYGWVVYNMIIYVGKESQFDLEYDAYPVSSRVVLSLMKPYLGNVILLLWITITLDNN